MRSRCWRGLRTPTFGILKTALLVGLRYLVCTLLMAGIYFLMGWVVVNLFTPAFLLGFGCCAMLCSFLLVNIITAIGGDPDAAPCSPRR